MFQLRTAVKSTFALLAVWLGLVWAGLLPRPAILPPELDIEPLTFLLGTIAALLLGFWKNPVEQSDRVTVSHPVTTADEPIEAEIRKYLKSRYEHRIRQKLAGREPVNLRKIPSSTGTSDEGAQNFITLPAEKVPSGMAELFDEARGRLLVVGAPGAGKTTLLLQLALALLERPGKDLPVLLNLATWRTEFATFDDWLQRILPLELGASKALTEKIRRNTPLILLLDGLDEVPEDARASCLKAIGEYGAEAKHRFVISSRIAEYAATQDAPVYLEVEVQPLTSQQVIDNLTAYVFHQPEAKPLLNALKTDPLLREAIANPFYLNTAQLLFATGRKYSDFAFAATDIAGRQWELVERFVEDALGRKVKRDYPKEKARKWLGFLAGKMEEEGRVQLELTDVHIRWGKSIFLQIGIWLVLIGPLYYYAALIIWKLTFLLLYKDTGNLSKNTFLLLGVSVGIAYNLIGTIRLWAEKNQEILYWDWLKFKSNWWQNFIYAYSRFWRFSALGLSILFAVIYAKSLKLPIGALLPTAYFCLTFGIGFGLISGIFAVFKSGIASDHYLRINYPYQRFISSLLNLELSIFVHAALRLALNFEGFLPLRLVTFLNEMSLRHLLEFEGDPETGKGGGSWRWRHRIIQEYFLEARSERREG